MATPASTSQRVLARSIALVTQYAASTSSSTSRASGLLNRNISAATGVRANATPATKPAAGPATRRTAAYSRATEATPSSACGASMLQLEKPKIRPESPINQSEAGGLSTVMNPAGSNAPNRSAFQLRVPDHTAAV